MQRPRPLPTQPPAPRDWLGRGWGGAGEGPLHPDPFPRGLRVLCQGDVGAVRGLRTPLQAAGSPSAGLGPCPLPAPLFILSVIISSCLVSAVLNPITPSPEEGMGSCSAGTAQGLSPVETLRAPGAPWSLQGPHAPHKWAQDWGPCARTPCLALGKTPTHCSWSPPHCRAPTLHGVLHPTVTPGPSCWPHGPPTPQRAGNGVPAPTPHPPWALHRALLWSPSSWKHRGVPGGDTCATAAPSPLWGSPTARPPGTAAGQGGVRAPPATGSGDLHVSALTPGRRGWDFSSFAPFNGHPGLR